MFLYKSSLFHSHHPHTSCQTFSSCHPHHCHSSPSVHPAACCWDGLYKIHSENSNSTFQTKSLQMSILLFNKIHIPFLFPLSTDKAGCLLSPEPVYPTFSLNKCLLSTLTVSVLLQDLRAQRWVLGPWTPGHNLAGKSAGTNVKACQNGCSGCNT